MIRFVRQMLPFVLVAGLLVPVWSGCEEDITAVIGTDRVFTLYGVLTPEADTQWVRVFPIELTLDPTRPVPLDARLTSVDETTGTMVVWADSIIQDQRGAYGHYYWSPFQALYGHTYRLEIERSDGARSWVTVPVPPLTEIVEGASSTSSPVILPIQVTGGAPLLNKLEVEYRVKFGLGDNTELTFPVDYHDDLVQRSESWLIPTNLTEDYQEIREFLRTTLRFDPSFGVVLQSMSIRFMVTNEAWNPPGGSFDPDVLVQPETMSNVENGFGFVGAGYRLSRTWLPDSAAVLRAGFRILGEAPAPSAPPPPASVCCAE